MPDLQSGTIVIPTFREYYLLMKNYQLGEFEEIVIKAAHREKKRLQFIDRTIAGPDHPVMSNCLESSYLKLLWARVF